ncbi:MAG: NAD(P)H-binding protein [Bryobacteraceae bacterium]
MVVISGATGYMGRPLTQRLLERGMGVRAIVRKGSAGKVIAGAEAVIADPFDASSFAGSIPRGATFVHMVGTPRPAPWKGRQFREVDEPAAMASIRAAADAGAGHFVYVSVAHPAPVMRAYIEVRRRCEEAVIGCGVRYTILRPWYVLGPGHWWPYALLPGYWVAEKVPGWRESARRLGLVTHERMLDALEWAVEEPPRGGIEGEGGRILEAPFKVRA